jgi:transcriptional regulator with XRE-family HTH domain/quercetin dioxygenase-like cupin family protein
MSDEKSLLSRRVKALREQRGWSIAELARRTGVSVSMLWKVENAQTTLTYGKLAKLAAGLDAPIGELFAQPEPGVQAGGRRIVERRGAGPVVDVGSNLHRFLATEIAHKDYSPCVVEVAATGDGADAETHAGEEFTYVLEGRVRFVCGGYAPVILEAGDSVYFDACQAHRYLCVDAAPARILCVYSHPKTAAQEAGARVEPHSAAMRLLDGLKGGNEPQRGEAVRRSKKGVGRAQTPRER